MTRLRDEPQRLDVRSYPAQIRMRASFSDVDSFRHLNNVAIARFFEEGRAALNMALFGVDTMVRPDSRAQMLIAAVSIEYLSEGNYPGEVNVGTAVSRVGRSSYTLAQGLFQAGHCIALCEAVMVFAADG